MYLSLAHIHITSYTFTVSSLSSGFMSRLIQSFITYVTRIGEALLNGPTSHDRNTRHTSFEPKGLYSCPQRSIMQYRMRNQCSDLFTCIMDYLHILCATLMVYIYVLCMTHGIYLHVLWTIYIYKFSICFAIVFHIFSIPMTGFLDNSDGFTVFAQE
jgi:hypothetical protein